MSEAAVEKPLGRPMKFPYTFSAKIAQFPLKFYIKNQWIWRYYFIALGVSLPVFYKIDRMGKFGRPSRSEKISSPPFSFLANSPGNVAKWAESKRKEAEEHH